MVGFKLKDRSLFGVENLWVKKYDIFTYNSPKRNLIHVQVEQQSSKSISDFEIVLFKTNSNRKKKIKVREKKGYLFIYENRENQN